MPRIITKAPVILGAGRVIHMETKGRKTVCGKVMDGDATFTHGEISCKRCRKALGM